MNQDESFARARETYRKFLHSAIDSASKDRKLGKPFTDVHRRLSLIARRNVPLHLYRYYSNEALKRTMNDISSGRLYLSNPVSFNDVFDVRPLFDKAKIKERMNIQVTEANMLETYRFYGQLYPDKINQMMEIYLSEVDNNGGFESYKKQFIDSTLENMESFIEDFRSYPRCSCLTETYTSSVMWGLYANNNRGFAVSYEMPRSPMDCCCERLSEDDKCMLARHPLAVFPILYEGRPDITDFSDTLGGSQSLIPYLTERLYLTVIAATAFKAKEWEHEREWRIVCGQCQYAPNAKMYVRLKASAVYLGYQVSKENQEFVLRAAAKLSLPVYKAKVLYATAEDDMTFQPLNDYCGC